MLAHLESRTTPETMLEFCVILTRLLLDTGSAFKVPVSQQVPLA